MSLEQFWAEIEKILPDEDTASQARLARETGHLLKPQKRRRQALLEAWGCQPLLRRNRGRARCDSEYLFSFRLCKKIERKPRTASFAFQLVDSEAGFVCLIF